MAVYSWCVLALLLACCSATKSTLKDLKVKRRRRTQGLTGGTSGSYSYGGSADTYGADGSSYGGGGNAINNLFGNSYGGGTKTYSYAYSYGDESGFSPCKSDPNNASTAGFLCSDGRTCIEGAKSCDSKPDCPDHSDELGCDFECMMATGTVTGFKCQDGSCAEAGTDGHRLCDGTSDCADGSDELGCGFECVLPHGGRGIECSDGQCIHQTYACDGEANCKDGSDEMGCAFQCTTSIESTPGWYCPDGTCVPGKHVCDGKSDCAGAADEMGCGFECNVTTADGRPTDDLGWRCDDHEGTCVAGAQLCDGTSDCPSGSDELGCGLGCMAVDGGLAYECKSRSLITNATECISEELVCNGEADCGDGSDEQGCSFCSPKCPNFYIGDGYCQVACLTDACRYDDGDCDTQGATGAAGVCHQCRTSSCEACFDPGVGSCNQRTDADCAWCQMCEPCRACFPAAGQAGGGDAGGSVDAVPTACTRPEIVPGLVDDLRHLCATDAFHDPPACSGACRDKWGSAKSSGCWLQVVSAAPPALLHTVQQVCNGACQDDVEAFGLLFVARCKAGIGSTDGTGGTDATAGACSLACREVLHAIANHACVAPIRSAMGADAAMTMLDQAVQAVEDPPACSPCSASIVQAVLMPVQEACREVLAKSDSERRVHGACSMRCAAALHVAQRDVCYASLEGARLSGAGSSTMGELGLVCPSRTFSEGESCADDVARLCAPAFADGADQACPAHCRDALQTMAPIVCTSDGSCTSGGGAIDGAEVVSSVPCFDAKPGFLESALTLCTGGCHKYHPVYESVTRECADELAEDGSEGEGGGGRRELQGSRVGDAGHPSGSAERQRVVRAKTCSLDCQESLAALNRSVLPSMCGDAPVAAQLARLEARCTGDAASVRCVEQFEHVVVLCTGLSMDSLSSWPASLPCSSDCHGTLAMFKSLACFDTFEAVAQTSGGDHLREAWTKLQSCRIDTSRDGLEGQGGRAAHLTPPLLPPRPRNQPFPPNWPPPAHGNGGRHRPPPPSPPRPRPPPSDRETLRGVAYGAGYYAGCRVLFDRNGNGREDEGEPANTTATAASGHPGEFTLRMLKGEFSLRARGGGYGAAQPLHLTVLAGDPSCTDTGTGAPARVQLFAPLPALADASREVTISPISSVLAHFFGDVTATEADKLVQGALGLRLSPPHDRLDFDALQALRENRRAAGETSAAEAALVLASGARILYTVALQSSFLAGRVAQRMPEVQAPRMQCGRVHCWDESGYAREVEAQMRLLVPSIFDSIAAKIVSLSYLRSSQAILDGGSLHGGSQVEALDLSSEIVQADLIVEADLTYLLDGNGEVPAPHRIVADVNHRVDLAVDELIGQPLALLARLEAIGRVVLGGAVSGSQAGATAQLIEQGAVGCVAGRIDEYTGAELECIDKYTGAKLGKKIVAAQSRGAAEVRGCTYHAAPNFNPSATADDGSCELGSYGLGGGGLGGGAIAAIVLLAVGLPWVLLCGAWRLGYLDKFIQKRRGRVRVGGNEAYVGSDTSHVGAGAELPLSSQQMGSELPYLPPVGAELPALSRLAQVEAVIIEQAAGGGDLPFAQALPDERTTTPLVLSSAAV